MRSPGRHVNRFSRAATKEGGRWRRAATSKLACLSKAVAKDLAVGSTCLAKAEEKFSTTVAKIEAKTYKDSGCLTTGDASSVEAAVDALYGDVNLLLASPATTSAVSNPNAHRACACQSTSE